MKFLILRRADAMTEAEEGPMPSEELLAAMGQYHEEMVEAGIFRAGEGLHPTAKGARVRISNGVASVIDGPFAETKELIAGFSMIDVPSKQDAIEVVKRWPRLDGDVTLEIRQMGCVAGCSGIEAGDAAALAAQSTPPEQLPKGKRFMVLLRSDAGTEADAIVGQQRLDALMQFVGSEVRAGRLLAGDGLRASALGARVSFKGGKTQIVDGPFAELKELIAGFWMIRAESKQDAIEWAKRCPYPTAPEVEVEIRQVFEAEDFGAAFTPELREAEERMRAQALEAGLQATLAGAR